MYSAGLSVSGYFKDHTDQTTYLKSSTFLADINNERPAKNLKYWENMKRLSKYVLVTALNDSTVIPLVSESFGYWNWGEDKTLISLRDSPAYLEDWIGLKTLDEQGKLVELSYQGDHVRWSNEFWSQEILPFFSDPKTELI